MATALSYSPSTVSQQLKQLEKAAGVPLLIPDGRRVRLTAAGQELAAHAAIALDLDEAVRTTLGTLEARPRTVRLAVMQTAAESLVPAVISILAERMPDVSLRMVETPPEQGLLELSARAFDLVVAEQYPGHTRALPGNLRRHTLGFDPINLALPGGLERGQAGGAPVRLEDLAEHPWVMEPRGTAAREWTMQQCRAAGFEPRVHYEAADLIAHVRLVAAGHAVAMLPDLVWSGSETGVVLTELPGSPAREIFCAERDIDQDRPPVDQATKAVREALRDALAAHPGLVSAERKGPRSSRMP